jgi:hypothetical protein
MYCRFGRLKIDVGRQSKGTLEGSKGKRRQRRGKVRSKNKVIGTPRFNWLYAVAFYVGKETGRGLGQDMSFKGLR